MKYTIYKITNKLNNKYYIGIHATENPYDSYMGSGKIIKTAVLKYGKDNFEKEILHIFDTLEEALLKEKEIVTDEFVKRPDVYNISLGGGIGGKNINGLTFKDKKHTEITKEKIANASKGRTHNKGRLLTSEHKKKIGAKNAISLKGKPKTEEHKQKIRDAILKKNNNIGD